MCGRYYVDEETAKEISEIVMSIGRELRLPGVGDIRPSESAAVIKGDGQDMAGDIMIWGFPKYDKRGLLINARAESIFERKTFRECALRRRCVIPAKGFYEWNQNKEKYSYERSEFPVLFMAGCYDLENRFVIITTEANPSVSPVHDRMPLIIEPNELEDWIFDDHAANDILHKTPPILNAKTEYEQMSLF